MRKCGDRVSAFSLVEVTLALGIAAVCLISIFGLLPVGVNSNKASIEQTKAVNLLTAVVSDLRSTAKTASVSPGFGISIKSSTVFYLGEDGTAVPKNNARYRVQSALAPSPGGRSASTGNILISWPAQQDDLTLAAGSVETFIALDRN